MVNSVVWLHILLGPSLCMSVALFRGHAVAQLDEALRYTRKVAGSIPDGVIGIFINIILPAALWSWG